MSCGIYLLKFNGTDKVYVGQSVNIEYRYKKHIQALKRGSANYKLQKAYSTHGEPELVILTECEHSELNELENEAIAINNSVENGFNIAEFADIHGMGDKNPASKYSNAQILEVLELLSDVYNSYKEIEEATGVSLSTVRHIANKEAHTWLATASPILYAKMCAISGADRQSMQNSALKLGKEYPTIISPEGIEYRITHISNFAKEHGLDASSLAKVLKKTPRYLSHKGWKIKNE